MRLKNIITINFKLLWRIHRGISLILSMVFALFLSVSLVWINSYFSSMVVIFYLISIQDILKTKYNTFSDYSHFIVMPKSGLSKYSLLLAVELLSMKTGLFLICLFASLFTSMDILILWAIAIPFFIFHSFMMFLIGILVRRTKLANVLVFTFLTLIAVFFLVFSRVFNSWDLENDVVYRNFIKGMIDPFIVKNYISIVYVLASLSLVLALSSYFIFKAIIQKMPFMERRLLNDSFWKVS